MFFIDLSILCLVFIKSSGWTEFRQGQIEAKILLLFGLGDGRENHILHQKGVLLGQWMQIYDQTSQQPFSSSHPVGYLQPDIVAHCGGSMAVEFINRHLWRYVKDRQEAVEYTRSQSAHSDHTMARMWNKRTIPEHGSFLAIYGWRTRNWWERVIASVMKHPERHSHRCANQGCRPARSEVN
jgi:hypothetical protein